MIFLCHIEHSHAAIVGADVVERLHPLDGVAQTLGFVQALAMYAQGFVKSALVAQGFSPFAQGYDAPQSVALGLKAALQPGERVYARGDTYQAVHLLPFLTFHPLCPLVAGGGKEGEQRKRQSSSHTESMQEATSGRGQRAVGDGWRKVWHQERG